MRELDGATVRDAVRAALDEDLGPAGDVTTAALFEGPVLAVASICARQDLIVAGLAVARAVFLELDPTLDVELLRGDGERVGAGCDLLRARGDARAILRGERTALNFLMRMCGVATAAASAVEEVRGTGATILDTRKTAPGLRRLDKYAVAAGGATNHRLGLYDAVMIKDTHLAAGLDVTTAVVRALAQGHPAAEITVEVHDLAGLQAAIAAGAGRVLLDNMDLSALRQAVRVAAGRVVLEASGGLRPGRLRAVAECGVPFLSVGWLTHSSPAADLALELEVAT